MRLMRPAFAGSGFRSALLQSVYAVAAAVGAGDEDGGLQVRELLLEVRHEILVRRLDADLQMRYIEVRFIAQDNGIKVGIHARVESKVATAVVVDLTTADSKVINADH